jgi:hypothetical protein
MNNLPSGCPVCGNTLTVTRLQCGNCGTGIDGAFGLGRLQALNPEQVQFLETFVKSRGKIKDVEEALGISYPTVVSRLNDLVRAMGFEVSEEDLSEVDQYEYYQAQVINPKVGPEIRPNIPLPPVPPMPGVPAIPAIPAVPGAPGMPRGPVSKRTRLTDEQRQQIMDDLEKGKITAAEAMEKLSS